MGFFVFNKIVGFNEKLFLIHVYMNACFFVGRINVAVFKNILDQCKQNQWDQFNA